MYRARRHTLPVLLAVIAAFFFTGQVGSAGAPVSLTAQQDPWVVHLEGQVTGRPGGEFVSGAEVSIPELGLAATTDSSGHYSIRNIPLAAENVVVTLQVRTGGYGDWTLQNLVLSAYLTMNINPEMSAEATLVELPPVEIATPASLPTEALPAFEEFVLSSQAETIPATIRVGITGKWQCDPIAPYTVQVVDFISYVKHVLPNEWYKSWYHYPEAYKAGAVAIKMYAWYWIVRGGKWPGVDMVDSTCDQYYIPGATFGPTDKAVDDTWMWKMTRNNELFQPFHKETNNCDPPYCMKQSVSLALAQDGYTWDQILSHFYTGSTFTPLLSQPAKFTLRFLGSGSGTDDRLAIRVDDPAITENSPAVDVGWQDFTVEWWMRANLGENTAKAVDCGPVESWIDGNVILDRDRSNGPGSKWGVSLADGKIAFGVTGPVIDPVSGAAENLTLCSSANVADLRWHHIAIQRSRSDGKMWLFVDGHLEAWGDGPNGDISYPNDAAATDPFDPFLVVGASRRDAAAPYVSFHGTIDEMRISSILRYPGADFIPLRSPFMPDVYTTALYHFDEGLGSAVRDTSGSAGGPYHGIRYYGGRTNGPEWVVSDLFIRLDHVVYLPLAGKSGSWTATSGDLRNR
ncbi:MAG: hypothetical protein EHM70_21220 [Chloroflexota bacterium]|nr:MAG: hypothetical protein EHM70_21220 [Chloroflexota bacterium]